MDHRPTRAPAASEQDWWWIFDPRLSLRARAALLLGGGALLFAFLFAWLAGSLLRQTLERQLGAGFETLAFQVSDKLDRVIYQRSHDLQLAAGLGPFRSPDGSPDERRNLLEAVQDGARDFAWIGFADGKGQVRAATRGIFEDTPVDARPWFRVGRERTFVGSLVELPALARELAKSDADRGQRFLEFGVPVQSVHGQFLGVLGAQVHWDWAREVQLSVVPESARRERIGVTIYAANGEVLLDSGGTGWTQPPDAPVISDSRRFRGSLVETPAGGGAPYLTGFARSRGYREFRSLGWLITVRQPAELALAPTRALQRQIVGWGVALAVVLALISWIAAGRLARRLHAIAAAADRIREGDVLTVMPQPRGDGEYARLCGALGAMVEHFRARDAARENASRDPDPRRR